MDDKRNRWEFYGENDAYFAVSTHDKFKKENLTKESKEEFFQSGGEHFDKIWDEVKKHFVDDFTVRRALDFGCGVGRLVIPLAARCDEVVGVDISSTMLAEAERNCRERGIENVSLYQTEEFFKYEKGKFDFIHTFIVLQHINPIIGEKIISDMINMLENGGIGVLHFTYFNPGTKFNWLKFRIYRDYPLINRLKNLVKRTKQEPFIPMYFYDVNKIMAILQSNDCHNCLVKFSDHGFYGAVLIFRRMEQTIF